MGLNGIWMTGNTGQNVVISGSALNPLTLSGGTINGTGGLGILVDNTNAFALTVSAPMFAGLRRTLPRRALTRLYALCQTGAED